MEHRGDGGEEEVVVVHSEKERSSSFVSMTKRITVEKAMSYRYIVI